MTRYDFTTQPNRLDQNTMKWHEAESNPELLELWVADMDFLPVPEIRDAVINYAETHIFGYPYPSDELYQSIINWEKNQHGYVVDKVSMRSSRMMLNFMFSVVHITQVGVSGLKKN